MTTRSRANERHVLENQRPVSLLLHSIAATTCGLDVTVEALRCEYLINPLGIDATEPHLGWILASQQRGQKQTAYQILVASSGSNLALDRGDLWDSGKAAVERERPGCLCRQAVGIANAMFLESAGLGQGRKARPLERTGDVDDGAAQKHRLGGEVDRHGPGRRKRGVSPASERPLFWTGRRPTRECM